jgi:hypothetical protein
VPSWSEVASAAPELAALVRARFEATGLGLLASLRRDGSPRISGIEASFRDGDLWFGSMADARKALDLRRDPRFALHTGTADPPDWDPDAKLSGLAEEVEPNRFRADIREAVLVGLNDARDKLVIEVWTPAGGVRRIER